MPVAAGLKGPSETSLPTSSTSVPENSAAAGIVQERVPVMVTWPVGASRTKSIGVKATGGGGLPGPPPARADPATVAATVSATSRARPGREMRTRDDSNADTMYSFDGARSWRRTVRRALTDRVPDPQRRDRV